MPTPAFEKNNELTQMFHRMKQINAAAGMPAGRGASGQPVTVGPGPSVRTAAMNDPVPLSAEEVEARDKEAEKLGIVPPTVHEQEEQYASMAAALAAAGGTDPHDVPDSLRSPRMIQHPRDDRQSAREFLAARDPEPIIRLPDFRNVSGFDFHRNVVYIDGLEFALPEADVREMKGYAVELALNHVVMQLTQALLEFGIPKEAVDIAAEKVKERARGTGEVETPSTQEGEGPASLSGEERVGEGGNQTSEGTS